ncbi:hypothetical protein AFLA_011231 [Aspergillus flavus NRRL3357]|nr:uncharacterized protein G4B84_000114 [Aspergillus flavus NRRL3357]KAF7630610.1 hypothetical protein AFLA_011231 [Aspergillus flavus NRRL3357]QMW24869.1 hypothetical protein G4B84_000114 [Aspergillus flavus NRRL3357]
MAKRFRRRRTDVDQGESDGEGTFPSITPEISLKTVLDDVLLKLEDKNGWQTVSPETRQYLATQVDAGKSTALHLIVKHQDKKTAKKVRPLIQYLAQEHGQILCQRDNNNDTPLHIAIRDQNDRMVYRVLQAFDNLDEALAHANDSGKNCIHLAIEKKSRDLWALVESASAGTLSAKDNNGNTPLHLAVDYERLDHEDLHLIVETIVNKSDPVMRKEKNGDFNNFFINNKCEQMSPYVYHLWTRNRALKLSGDIAEKDGERARNAMRELRNIQEAKPQMNETQKRITPGVSQIQPAFQKGPGQLKKGQGSVELNEKLLEGRESQVDPEQSTTQLENSISAQGKQRNKDIESAWIQRFLKMHYLRERGHDAALEILQGRNTLANKEIYLDLSNKSNVSVEQICQQTIQTLEFEDILQYVHIPKFKPSQPPQRRSNKRLPKRSLEDIERIFQSEKLEGVKTILKIVVEDLEEPPHTDTAIERFLKPKGVETWDWKKVDICPEVIQQAAPTVRHLNLYWSGRNAVLRGWSEQEGLRRLKQLEKITLHVLPSRESKARIEINLSAFERRIRRLFISDRAEEVAHNEYFVDDLKIALKESISESILDEHRQRGVVGIGKAIIEATYQRITKVLIPEMSKYIAQGMVQHFEEIAPSTEESDENLVDCAAIMKMTEPFVVTFIGEMFDKLQRQIEKLQDIDSHPGRTKEAVEKKIEYIIREQILKDSLKIKELSYQLGRGLSNQLRALKVAFDHKLSEDANQETSALSISSPKKKQTQKWTECMKSFNQTLFTALENDSDIEHQIHKRGEPIVVAVIDDGVDIEQMDLKKYGSITGRSFCPQPHDPKFKIPHYNSSRGHGTLMAKQIHRICPKANLLVLKLEDRDDRETNKRCITPISAANAIRYAVQRKVHIISMSWSIRAPAVNNISDEFNELRGALQEAQNANILLFSSASDQGPDTYDTYPAFGTSAIFKIGGADVDGNLHAQVGGEDNVHYIFPGDTFEGDDNNDGLASRSQWFTGSSVATAYASGFAALILYCAQVRIALSNENDRVKCTEAFRALKTHSEMERVFRNIGKTKKYLPVWEVFGRSHKSHSGTSESDFIASVPVNLYPEPYS